MPEIVASPSATQPPPGSGRSIQLTPELVKKIAARVYALMLADIKLERERQRYSPQKSRDFDGGHYAV